MNGALKLIIVVAVVALIAFPILGYLGYNSPLPFADWCNTAYTYLSTKLTTTFSTVYGLVGATGVSAALAAGLGFALKQKNNIINSAKQALNQNKADIENLSGQTKEQQSLIQQKDEAFTKINTEKASLETSINGYKTQLTSYEQKLHDQEVALAAKTEQNVANFTKTLPGESVTLDPTTGNLIKKTSEKYVL